MFGSADRHMPHTLAASWTVGRQRLRILVPETALGLPWPTGLGSWMVRDPVSGQRHPQHLYTELLKLEMTK